MESTNARMNEIEEVQVVDEIEEVSENSNAGSLIAGVIGGFLAYAIIGGAKKLKVIIDEKRAARRNAEIADADSGMTNIDAGETQSDS